MTLASCDHAMSMVYQQLQPLPKARPGGFPDIPCHVWRSIKVSVILRYKIHWYYRVEYASIMYHRIIDRRRDCGASVTHCDHWVV